MLAKPTWRRLVLGASAFVVLACNAIAGLDRNYELEGATPSDGGPSNSVGEGSLPNDDGGDGGSDGGGGCAGQGGPTMVRVGTYCVDSSEVTKSQYAQFLIANPPVGDVTPPTCQWKTTFVPDAAVGEHCNFDPGALPTFPVVCVDWCDAYAFCKWAGKHLCGEIGGGTVTWDAGDDIDPAHDEWYRACSEDGKNAYPYGQDHVVGSCNENRANGATAEVKTFAACAGGYPGIYDMVGNVFEWEDSCNSGDADAGCKLRGGSWAKNDTDIPNYNQCSGRGTGDKRSARWGDVGFRCCSQ